MKGFITTAAVALLAAQAALAGEASLLPKAGETTRFVSAPAWKDWNGSKDQPNTVLGASKYLTGRLSVGANLALDLDSNTLPDVVSAGVTLDLDSKPIDKTRETVAYAGLGADCVDVGLSTNSFRADWIYGGQVGLRHAFTRKVDAFGEVNWRTPGPLDGGRTLVLVGVRLRG